MNNPEKQTTNNFVFPFPLTWKHNEFACRRFEHASTAQQLTAQLLWGRSWRYSHQLQQPDAWLHPSTGGLSWTPSPQLLALRPGDIVRYHWVANIPVLTHDCVYIGRGFVCDFSSTPHNPHDGSVCVHRIDRIELPSGRSKWQVVSSPTVQSLERLLRLWRALSSVGHYAYNVATFNCQHVVTLWCGAGQPHSHSARQLCVVGAAAVGAVTSIAILAASAAAAACCQ